MTDSEQHLLVLREMIRIADERRTVALDMLERVNKYNLALIAFAASFLSLLVTVEFPILIVQIAGACLIVSVFVALLNVSPKPIKGATLLLDEDIAHLKRGGTFQLQEYLLAVAELTENAASVVQQRVSIKKRWTTVSASFLVFSLLGTYLLYAYA